MNSDARSRGQSNLERAASSRIREALGAWVEEDFDRTASSSPSAVELLGKAVLWRVNPAPLVPLDTKHEAALVTLAMDPNLESPSLRTITLAVVLGRLTRVLGDLPVPGGKRQGRLVDCRNGSLHVGTLPDSGEHSAEVVARQVLADSLTLCTFLLDHLDLDADEFYGERAGLVAGLLESHRTDLEHRVARRLEQARVALDRWREHFDDDAVWEQAAEDLEAGAVSALPPEDFGLEMGGIDHECPVCGYQGRLVGRVAVESDVDVEGGPDGPQYTGFWRVWFYPRAFACNVCKLLLSDLSALRAATVPADVREVREEDLGEDFDAGEWAEALYASPY